MYDLFLKWAAVRQDDTVLDVGVTSDQSYTSSNYLEAWYPHKDRITAAGIDDASFLEQLYPGLRFVRADGLNLPFADRSFDVVHSSAVLEHVGSLESQARFIAQCARVARRALFLTTPNNWFPVEFHTVLPLVHWLPKPAFRALMRRSGRAFFAEEANLNLMTRRELCAAVASIAGSPDAERFDFRVESVRLWGWPSNLLVIGTERPSKKCSSAGGGQSASRPDHPAHGAGRHDDDRPRHAGVLGILAIPGKRSHPALDPPDA